MKHTITISLRPFLTGAWSSLVLVVLAAGCVEQGSFTEPNVGRSGNPEVQQAASPAPTTVGRAIGTETPLDRSTSGRAPEPGSTTGRELGTVLEVIDGDTIRVDIEGRVYTVRYIGVDTPETVHPTHGVEPYGVEASEANKRLVSGKAVELEKDVSETDRYGRLLRYVYVGGIMVNAWLVENGYAQVSTFPPDVKYESLFLESQREAVAAGLGMWSETAAPEKDDTPSSQSTPSELRYDPNGPDRDCGDFATHAEAQVFFEEASEFGGDPHRLDGDNDGFACESLR